MRCAIKQCGLVPTSPSWWVGGLGLACIYFIGLVWPLSENWNADGKIRSIQKIHNVLFLLFNCTIAKKGTKKGQKCKSKIANKRTMCRPIFFVGSSILS